MTYRMTLLAGAMTALAAVPIGAVAGTAGMSTTYELYGEQGPAAYQIDLHPDATLGTMQARSADKMDGAKGEFSAFEPMSGDAAATRSTGGAWDMSRTDDPTAVFPEGPRILP